MDFILLFAGLLLSIYLFVGWMDYRTARIEDSMTRRQAFGRAVRWPFVLRDIGRRH